MPGLEMTSNGMRIIIPARFSLVTPGGKANHKSLGQLQTFENCLV